MDQLPTWFLLGVPAGCLALGVAGVIWANYVAADFDRRYGKRG